MTRVEYELLRDERPDLELIIWAMIGPANRDRVLLHTRQSLIAGITAERLANGLRSRNHYISGFIAPDVDPLTVTREFCPYCNPYNQPPMHVQEVCWACGGTGLWKDYVANYLAAS